MKTSIRISLFALGAALIGLWSVGADAQTDALARCGIASPRGILGLARGGAANAAMIKRALKCLQGTGQMQAAGPQGVGGQFVTIDPPGSTFTEPTGITPEGTIAGYYNDASGVTHGFLRTPTGSYTTFDPPGSTSTLATSILPDGEIAGAYCDPIGSSCVFGANRGFVRAKDGTFTTFDAPGSGSSFFASFIGLSGPPPSINPAGAIAGTYLGAAGFTDSHGFLRAKNGVLTTIDAPGSTGNTEILGLNPSGVMIGDIFCCTGFIRFANGSFATIESPDICPGSVLPAPGGINPAGAVTGGASDARCANGVGFLRTSDGTITTFGVPGFGTFGLAINPAGLIAGSVSNCCTGHGFLRTLDGAITLFDAPGGFFTEPSAINPAGAIIGGYFDANFVIHGFLRLP